MAYKQVPGQMTISHRVCTAGRMTAASMALLLGLSACNTAPLPVAESFPTVTQPLVESAADWQMMAADVWTEVSTTLKGGGYQVTSIGLESPAQKTQFTQAMDDFLFTEAVSHGVAVNPDAPFTVTYGVQVLHYVPPIGNTTPLPDNDGWVGNDSTTEMVLTISVTDGNSVRIRQSKVYYIDDAEAALYEVPKSADSDVSQRPVVASNWYADNPHSVEPIAMHEANQFSLMVDPKHGPINTMDNASTIAAAHCSKAGKTQAKYIGESYPTNDRSQIKVEYECM